MSSKLYKLALWYIGKCNKKWNKNNENNIKKLDRLTYKNSERYMLFYSADAEWQNFSNYDVLDNAIQKLAKYENEEAYDRDKAVNYFVNYMDSWAKQIGDVRAGNVFFTMENIRDAANRIKGEL